MVRSVPNDLSVGDVAKRAGIPVSTLHYYEAEGLIESWRNPANHRRYDRAILRRLAIIKVAQTVGLSLTQIKEALAGLPQTKVIKADQWKKVSELWLDDLNERIALLTRLRDNLGSCIGCGCLSLDSCPLYNPGDELGDKGPGPRRWMGD